MGLSGRDPLANIANDNEYDGNDDTSFCHDLVRWRNVWEPTCKSLNDIKLYLNGDINDYLESVRVLLGVKLHYNDNEKATSMRKSQRKQFQVRSSWNLGMITRKTLSYITVEDFLLRKPFPLENAM